MIANLTINQALIRLKDIILLILATVALASMVWGVYETPAKNEEKIVRLETIYVPKIEKNENAVTQITEQYKSIIHRLQRIEKKMDTK